MINALFPGLGVNLQNESPLISERTENITDVTEGLVNQALILKCISVLVYLMIGLLFYWSHFD